MSRNTTIRGNIYLACTTGPKNIIARYTNGNAITSNSFLSLAYIHAAANNNPQEYNAGLNKTDSTANYSNYFRTQHFLMQLLIREAYFRVEFLPGLHQIQRTYMWTMLPYGILSYTPYLCPAYIIYKPVTAIQH